MPYAIMRFAKRKGGPASALEKHHERRKEQYASNPDVDLERSHLNYHLIEPQMKYYAEIQSRIERAQRKNPKLKVRKDSVKFIDTIVTASPEFLADLPEERVHHYFELALEFFKKEVGVENIFSAVVHMDERNPHMHLCFVPLTSDNRLSAKEVIGGREKLVEWQDKFHDHMSAEFPSLERGESAAVTKRKHIPTWLYKQAHRLTEEMTLIQKELERIGPLNANKQREKISKLLEKWYPQVNAFEAKLRPYEEQLKLMRYNETVLREQAKQAQWELQQEHQESLSLIHGLREYRGFLKSIPEEVLEGLMEQYGQMMEEQEQGHKFHDEF
ncbi:MobV family relaxase [Vermiculatibacterium agrestimuris]|uniref:MobV family relaxase n=1 Tax=Vermiculatibacterium agrestimuris TaxID=2941519 RepID=UPI00203D5295|nr:MobV family relaxase [Vermiculatibacterium agrestimuris]